MFVLSGMGFPKSHVPRIHVADAGCLQPAWNAVVQPRWPQGRLDIDGVSDV